MFSNTYNSFKISVANCNSCDSCFVKLVKTQKLWTDPSPWLCVSDAIKEKNKNKPYDPKKSVWVPNKVN